MEASRQTAGLWATTAHCAAFPCAAREETSTLPVCFEHCPENHSAEEFQNPAGTWQTAGSPSDFLPIRASLRTGGPDFCREHPWPASSRQSILNSTNDCRPNAKAQQSIFSETLRTLPARQHQQTVNSNRDSHTQLIPTHQGISCKAAAGKQTQQQEGAQCVGQPSAHPDGAQEARDSSAFAVLFWELRGVPCHQGGAFPLWDLAGLSPGSRAARIS